MELRNIGEKIEGEKTRGERMFSNIVVK